MNSVTDISVTCVSFIRYAVNILNVMYSYKHLHNALVTNYSPEQLQPYEFVSSLKNCKTVFIILSNYVTYHCNWFGIRHGVIYFVELYQTYKVFELIYLKQRRQQKFHWTIKMCVSHQDISGNYGDFLNILTNVRCN